MLWIRSRTHNRVFQLFLAQFITENQVLYLLYLPDTCINKDLDSRYLIDDCSWSPLFHENCAAKVFMYLIGHKNECALRNSLYSHNLCRKGWYHHHSNNLCGNSNSHKACGNDILWQIMRKYHLIILCMSSKQIKTLTDKLRDIQTGTRTDMKPDTQT